MQTEPSKSVNNSQSLFSAHNVFKHRQSMSNTFSRKNCAVLLELYDREAMSDYSIKV